MPHESSPFNVTTGRARAGRTWIWPCIGLVYARTPTATAVVIAYPCFAGRYPERVTRGDPLRGPGSSYPARMINLGTIAGLNENHHELHAFCARCRRWSVLDLATMVRNGLGSRRLPITVRCRRCGKVGELQVRPPMPERESAGWVSPGSMEWC